MIERSCEHEAERSRPTARLPPYGDRRAAMKAGRRPSLEVVVPIPAEIAADAVVLAQFLIAGVAEHGVRLRRAELATACIIVRDGVYTWSDVRLMTRFAKLHLTPPG